MVNKFLISGTSSGLGKYLLEELNGTPFDRTKLQPPPHNRKDHDVIIHCAADARHIFPPEELHAYYQSNIALTEYLTKIPHRFLVFISSAAVYPDVLLENKETDVPNIPETSFPVHQSYHVYGLFKLLAEQIVARNSNSHLILRCVSIVGRTGRFNNIMKILHNDPNPLTLSAESSFNLVSMEQIKDFIEFSVSTDLTGVFNVGSTKNATLGEIAKAVGSTPNFGKFNYNAHRMDTSKIRSAYPGVFDKTSLEIAIDIANELRLQNTEK